MIMFDFLDVNKYLFTISVKMIGVVGTYSSLVFLLESRYFISILAAQIY